MPIRHCPYCGEELESCEYADHVMDCDTPDSLEVDNPTMDDLSSFYEDNIDDCPVEGGKENL